MDGTRDLSGYVSVFSKDDVPSLNARLDDYPDVRLLIIDPWARYLDEADNKGWAMPDEFNPYAGTTGLKSDFIGVVTDESEFCFDNEYNANSLVAKLYIVDEADGDEISQLYSTGSKWTDGEGGTEAVREDGSEPRGFNKSTNWQRFIDHMYKNGGDAFMDGSDGTLPWQISLVRGLKARWDFIEYKDMNGEDKNLLVPVEIIEAPTGGGKKKATTKRAASSRAKKDETEAAPTAAEKAAAAKAKAAAKKAEAAGGDNEGDANLAAIIAIAQETDSHDEFMQKVYEDVADADAYEDQITDEAFYDTHHG